MLEILVSIGHSDSAPIGQWTTLTPGTALRLPAAGVYGDINFYHGGFSTTYQRDIQRYNTRTNTWDTAIPGTGTVPVANMSTTFAERDGLFYSMGGSNDISMNHIRVLNPKTWVWSDIALPNSPIASRHSPILFFHRNKLHVIGGSSGLVEHETEHFEIDVDTKVITKLAPIATSANSTLGGTTYIDGKLYFIGGNIGQKNGYWVLDLDSDKLTPFSGPPNLYNSDSALVGDFIFTIGHNNPPIPSEPDTVFIATHLPSLQHTSLPIPVANDLAYKVPRLLASGTRIFCYSGMYNKPSNNTNTGDHFVYDTGL